MKRFRVRGSDVKTREPVAFEAFEAKDRDEVFAKLNAAGIVVESADEVRAPGVAAAVVRAVDAVDERTEAERAEAEKRRQDIERSRARRGYVTMAFTWQWFFGIMLAVAFGILLSGVIGAMFVSFLAAVGRARMERTLREARTEAVPDQPPQEWPVEMLVLLGVALIGAIVFSEWKKRRRRREAAAEAIARAGL